MKAGSKFLNAVSAVALSTSMVATGSGVLTLASASVAEAATISRVEVRGATRVSAETVRVPCPAEAGPLLLTGLAATLEDGFLVLPPFGGTMAPLRGC